MSENKRSKSRARAWALLGLLMLAAAGCRSKKTHVEGQTEPSVAKANPAVTSAEAPRARSASALIPPAPKPWRVATGITLPITVGEGVGPIRFGATHATVERLMEGKCQETTPTFCRFSDRGVNFFFNPDGALDEIYISREERKEVEHPDHVFGVFNGLFSSKASLGMVPEALIEALGKPREVVRVTEPNINNTKERHVYESMILEYDLVDTGKLALGGITLFHKPGKVLPKPKTPSAAH